MTTEPKHNVTGSQAENSTNGTENAVFQPGQQIQTAKVLLESGGIAHVALSDSANHALPITAWRSALSNLDMLLSGSGQVLKTSSKTSVFVRKLSIGDREIEVAVKSWQVKGGLVGFLKSLWPARAFSSFKTAVKLCNMGVSVTHPLAAIKVRKIGLSHTALLVTEFIESSTDLYDFLRYRLPQYSNDLRLRKHMCRQIACVFASLHNSGLWHRDAKVSNFLVTGERQLPRLVLVDTDGIRRYVYKKTECRFRGHVKLAATAMWCGTINKTDYWRTFKIYCDLTGVDKQKRKGLFKKLSREAVALRLLTMARGAIENMPHVES